jgi:LPS-assembly protein
MPNRFRTIGFLLLSAFVSGVLLLSQGAEALVSLNPGIAKEPKEPWDIEATELTYNKDTEIYTAVGEVVIKKGTQILKCDYAQVDRRTMMALARGHVEFTSNGDELRGDEITVNLDKKTGEVKNGRLFLKKNNFHIAGQEILKTGESTYEVVDGTFTSCDGENVPWEITAKKMQVTLDGYGKAWSPSFRIKNIPIFYAPYIILPAKTTRQTGLLMPVPGQSSRDGLTLDLPFYWAISDNTDATLYGYGMSRRGFMPGAEYRYILSPRSKGTLMLDYLFKDLLAQEEFERGNISEPYTERYWFRGKINQELPANVDLKMDLDWVSDRDYLKEFRGMPHGLDQNRTTFLQEFNRDLDDETVINRRNSAVVTKYFGSSSLTGGFNFFEDVDKTGTNLNQLPFAQFSTIKQELGKGFFYQLGSTYNNYWRTNLDRGQVLEVVPTIYYPTKLRNYLNLEASLGLTETAFQVDNKLSDSVNSLGNRSVPNFILDMSTDIQKVFNFRVGDLQKIKHTITPQIIYNYIPDIKQDFLPSFVPPVNKLNTVTYYLTNTFTGKSLLGKGKDGEDLYGYRDLMRFKVYQTYDINVATGETGSTATAIPSTTISTPAGANVIAAPSIQPFSDVIGELEFVPGPYLTFRSSVGWSPYGGQFDTQTHNLSWSDKRGDLVYVEYLSSGGDQFRQINSNLSWKINNRWSANFLTRYSLDQNKNYETDLGIAYVAQCWGVKVTYSNLPDNQTFLVSFSLKGLGGF